MATASSTITWPSAGSALLHVQHEWSLIGTETVAGVVALAARHRVPSGTGANQLAPPFTLSTCPFSVQ